MTGLLALFYVAAAVILGGLSGQRITRGSSKQGRLIAQGVVTFILLCLPAWDYVPGRILFKEHCEIYGGLQLRTPRLPEELYLDKLQYGICEECIQILGTSLAQSVEAPVVPLTSSSLVSMVVGEGVYRFQLASATDPNCGPFFSWIMSTRAWSDRRTLNSRLEAFWQSTMRDHPWRGLRDRCVVWREVMNDGASYILTKVKLAKPRFYWTQLHESRLDLLSRVDGELVASYAEYQYIPWINGWLDWAPNLFSFECPGPLNNEPWARQFQSSKIYFEMKRRGQS